MIGGLLFDLDGTLIETDHLHARVFAEIGREHGIEIDRERYDAEIQGRMNAAIFEDLFPGADAEALSEEKEARFRELLGTSVKPMAGLRRLLDWAAGHRVKTAIVTNAPRRNAEAMLTAIDVAGRFDATVIAEELERGKPDPLPYLTGCREIGVEPAACVAFEDSRSGIRAASAAGIHVFGLRSSLDDADLRAAGAQVTLADFTDPLLWSYLDNKDPA